MPWERHFTALSPAWWSWQAVLNYSHISIKLQVDSNILAFSEAGRGDCLPMHTASFASYESGKKCRDKEFKITILNQSKIVTLIIIDLHVDG